MTKTVERFLSTFVAYFPMESMNHRLLIFMFSTYKVSFSIFMRLIAFLRIPITPAPYCGTQQFLTVHRYGPVEGSSASNAIGRCYIQASLHSDEVPAMLVAHKLIKMLDDFDKRGEIQKQIIVVPYANPIGLSQNILNSGIGVRIAFI